MIADGDSEKPFILYPQAVEGRTEGLLLIQFFLIE